MAAFAGAQNLLAAAPPAGAMTGSTLDLADAEAAYAEAVRRWTAAGMDTSALTGAVVVADLPGLILGQVRDGVVLLDRDAAGHGWFLDPTLGDDAEFAASRGGVLVAQDGAAAAGIDLLTVAAHETGHLLGLDDAKLRGAKPGGVMAEALDRGIRRLPEAQASTLAPPDPATLIRAIKSSEIRIAVTEQPVQRLAPAGFVVFDEDGEALAPPAARPGREENWVVLDEEDRTPLAEQRRRAGALGLRGF
jgi:hypothetical protein